MVTLIKEAVFPPGSCGGGVVEASFGACVLWLVDAMYVATEMAAGMTLRRGLAERCGRGRQ